MKILCIGPAYPLRGGIAKFNETLAINLKKAGNEVKMYSYTFQYPNFLFPGKTQFSNESAGPEIAIVNELHSLYFPGWGRTAKKILDEKPDLLIIHYWMPYFALQINWLLKKIKSSKIKVILLAHNLIPHEKQPFMNALTRRLLSRIDGLVCLSKSVRDDALSFDPKLKNQVLAHPVYDIYGDRVGRNQAIDHLKLDDQFRYILFFGLIRDYKGLDLLLKAMRHIEKSDLRLIVAGEFYDRKDKYLEIMNDQNLYDKVILVDDFIPDGEVKYYFSVADMVVQPYKTASQSGVTQIAYHFGIPMIVTKTGGLPEIVSDGETGFVVGKDPKEIAGAIDSMYENDLLEKMGLNVIMRKDEFSWKTFTRKLEQFSETL